MPAEPPTREDVSLETAPGEAYAYYDQVCALSQETINKNFETLFKQRSEKPEDDLSTISWEGDEAHYGTITATLLPPRIIIEPYSTESSPEIYFSLRFGPNSRIEYPGAEQVDVSNWVITVIGSLDEMTLNPNEHDDAKKHYETQAALGEVLKTFKFPEANPDKPEKMIAGEYSVFRLFASISQTRWTMPVMEHSRVPVGPNGMTLEEWENLSDENRNNSAKVKLTLQMWAMNHRKSAFFTLGLQIRVPKPGELDAIEATFAPARLRLQGYPYIDDQDYRNNGDKAKAIPGIKYNCLLYCETVEPKAKHGDTEKQKRPFPVPAALKWTGNLAMPEHPVTKQPVAGSFVLDHRLFFDQYLITELQELCIAAQVIPLKNLMKTDPNKTGEEACISQAVTAAGGMPDLSEDDKKAFMDNNGGQYPPKEYDHTYFTLKKSASDPWRWEWSQKLQSPGSRKEVYLYDVKYSLHPVHRKYVTESTTDVVVRRQDQDGKPKMVIEVQNKFYHWEGYYSNPNFSWESHAGTDVVLWGSYTVTTNWSLGVSLVNDHSSGVIVPQLVDYNEETLKPKEYSSKVTRSEWMLYDGEGKMRTEIENAVTVAIKRLVKGLNARFSGSGRFVYPGTGTFEFGPPTITKEGNVYASIDYKPLPKGRVQLKIPSLPPRNPDVPNHRPRRTPIDSGTKERPTPPSINWSPLVTWDSKKKRGKLVLKGIKQPGGDAIAFARVTLTVSQDIKTKSLFIGEKWISLEEAGKRAAEEAAKKKAAEESKKNATGKKPGKGDGKDPNQGPPTDPQPEPEPEPEPEEPKLPDTYTLAYTNIARGTYIKGIKIKPAVEGKARELSFTLAPEGDFEPLRPRFILYNDSTVSLTVEGEVEAAGTFILQIRESLSKVNMTEEMSKAVFADTWLAVTLTEGKTECKVEAVSYARAMDLLGKKASK